MESGVRRRWCRGSTATRRPALSERNVSFDSSGSAPKMRMSGLRALAIVAQPASRPPPPIGAIKASRCGITSNSSSAAVPWPAMIMG